MDVTILQADLFATKGMEYAAVLLYLGLFVGFWRLLRNPEEAGVAAEMRGAPGDEAGAAMDTTGAGARGWFTLPEGLLHHQGHTWVRPNGGRAVTVGMNEFARKLVGAPEGITLPAVGTRLEQGHHAWELNIDGAVIPMLSPVDGEVLEVNLRALEAPGEILDRPYEDGWLLKVGVGESRSRASLKNLLAGSPARAWMADIEERIRTQHSGELGVVMPDGGEPVDGLARALSPEDWDKVARQFLLAD
jgi:glycine cleavage system H lipoate-binding protein